MARSSMKFQFGVLGILAILGLGACGGSGDGSAVAIMNGQRIELKVQRTYCEAGLGGSAYGGAGDAPLKCTQSFRSGTSFSDYVTILVRDVRPVAEAYLGVYIPLDGSLVDAEITLQGQPQALFTSEIRFTEISNVAGHPVCADYILYTGIGVIQGNFCKELELGL